MADDAEAAAVELLELARGERRPDRAELLAEPRAEHRQVRLHAQLGGLDVAEHDLLHPQLLAISSAWPSASGAPSTTRRPQRLAELQLAAGARLAAELDDAAHLGDLGEQRLVGGAGLGPAGEVHRLGGSPPAPRTRLCQRCSARNGMTGATTRSPCTSAYQSDWSASVSPSQKRRRERRMYQFERSSTNASKARITLTVRNAS